MRAFQRGLRELFELVRADLSWVSDAMLIVDAHSCVVTFGLTVAREFVGQICFNASDAFHG